MKMRILPLLFLCFSFGGCLEVAAVTGGSCSGTECGKYFEFYHQGPGGDPDQSIVVVSISAQFQNIAASSLTATFGSRDMEVAGEFYDFNPPQGIRGIKIFYLYDIDASPGLQVIKIDWFGQALDPTDGLVAGAVTYLGAQQGATVRFAGGTKEVTMTGSHAGNIIQDVLLFSKEVAPVPTGTLLWLAETSFIQGGAQYKPGSESSVLMEWEPLGSFGVLAAGAIDIMATTASRAPTTRAPSTKPTRDPTASPSAALSPAPSQAPSASPSSGATSQPTAPPTVVTLAPSSMSNAPSFDPTFSPSASPSNNSSPTSVAGQTTDPPSNFPWFIVVPILLGVPCILLLVCGYYVFKLKRRVYKAEELFMAPSDFARLVNPPEFEREDTDMDALDFSESRQSRASNFSQL